MYGGETGRKRQLPLLLDVSPTPANLKVRFLYGKFEKLGNVWGVVSNGILLDGKHECLVSRWINDRINRLMS